ncbi:hypothetical protein PGT21_011398 [Puccinia graminis f. sp. tritici]|uniref:Uncharacterized protein n=1 Tax=Puccinia graminis f. sp. tritici TaxID=56615 RepID=A0A5B0RT45_PUCGR|nr:hypothetical protein PGT21_011398 [Puccinia graminis f. sp. tritici]KAA1128215.1 hypothetical protein PGTUg99_007577 [Puccinia graminis f. sp. tritici]
MAFANFNRRPIKIIQPGMVYVISFGGESPGTCSGKVKGKQLKRKGKRSGPGKKDRGGQPAGIVFGRPPPTDYWKKL